jgi:hypothetical protein
MSTQLDIDIDKYRRIRYRSVGAEKSGFESDIAAHFLPELVFVSDSPTKYLFYYYKKEQTNQQYYIHNC